MDWKDGVDTWIGDGSPTHTFQHTYRLTTPGRFLYQSSISSKFTVSDYSRSHTESDLGYQTNHVISLPTITLNSPATTAAFTDVSVSYDYLVTGRTYTVNWGDGTSQPLVGDGSQQTVTHQYKKDGVYQITTLGSVNLTNSAPPTVTVQSPPPTLTVSGTGPKAVLSFSGLQGGTDYTVDWGDGSSTPLTRDAPGQQPSHTYAAPGTYTVKLYGPAANGSVGVLTTGTFTATLGNVGLSAAPDRPVIGGQVVLTLTGLAEAATYELDWGDGTVESGITGQTTTTRSHAYTAARDYTVTVRSGGQPLGTTTVAVQVPTPVLSHTAQGLTLTLQVQNLVAGAAYTVSWGQGTPESLNATGPAATLTHTYTAPGTYTVTVTPARGAPATESVSVVASQAKLTVTPPVVDTDQPVTAAMMDLVPALEYMLDWNDGSPPLKFTPLETQATQTHVYTAPGTYQVELSAPNVNPATAPVTVRPGGPILTLTADTLTATLSAGRLYRGVAYTIDWGGGATERFTATGPTMTLTHLYSAPGTKTVTVTPDGGTPVTASVTLSVPTPVLTVTPAQGQTDTAFTASLSGLVPSLTYTLAWGDGSTEAVTGVSTFTRVHQYALPGTFAVTVTSPDAPPAQQSVTVRVPAPVLGTTSTNLTLTLQLGRLVKTAAYRVQWGDAQEQTLTAQSTETTLSHTYAAPGTYTVTVTPELGDAASVPVTLQYVSVDAPVLSVTPSSANVYAEVRSDFRGLIPSLSYTLDWGDGQRDTITGVTEGQKVHTYPQAGTYTVSLKAPQSPAATAPVTVTQPVPVVTATSTALEAQVTVTGLIPALTYRLEWGDGTPAVEITGVDTKALTHTYGRPGVYPLTLTVPGAAPVKVTVNVAVTAATLSATTDALTVTANVSGLQKALTYTLNWGDGSNRTVSGVAADTLTHTYAKPGTYTLTLSTPGTADVTASVTLSVPTPVLTVTPAQGQTDTAFTASLSGLVPSLTYTLAWGDGSTEAVTGVSTFTRVHQYALPGTFAVTVTSPDAPPAQQSVTVRVPAPVLGTTSTNLTLTLQLGRLVKTAAYRVQWGDAQEQTLTAQSTETTLSHTYAAPGTYTVTITPELGDAASVPVTLQYVSVDAPILSVTPSSANVYAEVRSDFRGLIPSLSYTLDWGDGQRDTITGVTEGQKVHTYPQAGTYTVSLKAPQSPAATAPVTVTQPVPVVTATSTALEAQVTVTGLIPALTYRLEWGDGTPAVEITGVDTKALTHTYGRPGVYPLTLTVPGAAPVKVTVNVAVTAATLSATTDALTVTANVSGLQKALTYTLNWGDGSNRTVSGVAADTLTHTYAKPGTYTLTLSTPGTADVTATAVLQVKPLTLQVVSPELRASATLGGLVSALTYTVDWGDGQQDTVTGRTTTTLVHTYLKPGQYTVTVTAPGLDLVTTTFTAGLPPREVITATPGSSPDVLDFRITGLLTGATYLLDYGDGQVEPLTFTGQSGRWTHRYAQTGIYTLTLSLRTPDGVSSVRAVTTVQAQQPLTLSAATLAFPGGPSGSTLTLSSLDPVGVRLNVAYTGSGSLTGQWVLDGQAGPTVTVDLPEGSTAATATYTVAPPKPGRHTLSFQITGVTPRCAAACSAPRIPAANTLSYTLDVPTALTYGNLTVKLTGVTNLDLQSFSGTGTVRLIVGGSDLGAQNVTLSALQVTRTEAGYKVTGGAPTRVDLGSLQLRVLSLGQADVRLQTLTLKTDGATLSGRVQLPGNTGEGLAFRDAALQEGGELFAELSGEGSGIRDATLGTGITVSAVEGVLDLSRKQNSDVLKTAYARSEAGAPGPEWMGVVLPTARMLVGAPLVTGTVAGVTGPAAYTLGGYTTAFDLESTTLSFGGWSVRTAGMQVTISGGVIAKVSGKGSLTVPMVNEALPLNIGWNTQLGTPGAKWVFSAAGSPAVHDFGRTKLDLGTPAWETRGDGTAKLTFSNARWNLGGVSGAEVKLPLYNLTFTPDGGVSLNGEAWASATGLTNFSLFQYPFPAADVGVAYQGAGQYTLSLRGKLQLTEAVPLSGTVEPVNFWVKDGKDVKIVFEKLRVKGEIKTVSFDVAVSAMFKDENTLEFIGEGDLTIAKKLGVGVKAGFGRENGTGYGFLWAKYRAPDLSVKPLATVGAFGFYEFNGGLAINMSWKDGNFDVPPVKAIPKSGVTVAVQAGTVFGPWADKGSTVHFRGALGIDTAGTIAISAKGWFLTLLKDGAFGTEQPNAAALVVLNVPVDDPSSGYFLAQACVGPATNIGRGLDCSKNRELEFAGIMALRGYAEVYTPFSGDGQHVYLGTKQNPIGVRLLALGSTAPSVPNADATSTTPAPPVQTKQNGLEINGYLMFASDSVRAGFGANYRYRIGEKGEGAVCNWHWEAEAWVGINADFAVIYNPTALDASVSLGASASAGAGACGVDVTVGVSLTMTGRLYVSAASRFFEGTFAGRVTMPVIPDISFSVNGRADF
ncbi:PKD domain-containing protein [Deinococcus hopiensis]|nr:PKD domain-containing protein [Deinococcus hopiensis]